MCKHENVTISETIEAYSQRVFTDNEFYCNNEYGNQIRVEAYCHDCNKRKIITAKNQSKQPKWIRNRIDILVKADKWFFV